jgi:hypothetical protein
MDQQKEGADSEYFWLASIPGTHGVMRGNAHPAYLVDIMVEPAPASRMPDPTECREPTRILQCLQTPLSMELHRAPRLTRRNIALEKTSSIGGCLLLPLLGRGVSSVFDFLAAALTFTIASPIAWEHHYGILPVVYVATLFLLLNQERSTRRSAQLVMLTASFLITAHWFGGSWMLFGALVLLGLIYWIELLKRSSYCCYRQATACAS